MLPFSWPLSAKLNCLDLEYSYLINGIKKQYLWQYLIIDAFWGNCVVWEGKEAKFNKLFTGDYSLFSDESRKMWQYEQSL